MLHIVDVAEGGFPQMGGQGWEYGMRYGWLINLRCTAHEQLDERRQSFRHLGRCEGIGLLGVQAKTFLADEHGALHDFRHRLVLISRTSTLDGGHPLVLRLAIVRKHVGNPTGIVVADIAQVACHTENEVVTVAMLGCSAHLLFEDFYQERVGDFFVGFGISPLILVIQRSIATKDLECIHVFALNDT